MEQGGRHAQGNADRRWPLDRHDRTRLNKIRNSSRRRREARLRRPRVRRRSTQSRCRSATLACRVTPAPRGRKVARAARPAIAPRPSSPLWRSSEIPPNDREADIGRAPQARVRYLPTQLGIRSYWPSRQTPSQRSNRSRMADSFGMVGPDAPTSSATKIFVAAFAWSVPAIPSRAYVRRLPTRKRLADVPSPGESASSLQPTKRSRSEV